MDFKAPSSNGNHAAAQRPAGMGMGVRSSGRSWIAAVIVVLVLVILVGGAWWTFKMFSGDSGLKKDKYQAVFLTNGQVYFCKLRNVSEKYVDCTDIYYLQVQQSVQPSDKNNTNQQSQVSLAKLGSELHGPDDLMKINRDQILFWENLKDDGKVVSAIHDNQKK